MSVARNLWRVADAPHIVPADSVERQTAERLINACPAGLFSLTPEGNLRIDYRSCLECGTCRLLCDESTLQQWRYRHHLPLWINNKDNLCPSYTCSARIR